MYSVPIVYQENGVRSSFSVTLTEAGVLELQRLLENPAFAVIGKQSRAAKFTQKQVEALQRRYDSGVALKSTETRELSRQLGLSETQINKWFAQQPPMRAVSSDSSICASDSVKEQDLAMELAALLEVQ